MEGYSRRRVVGPLGMPFFAISPTRSCWASTARLSSRSTGDGLAFPRHMELCDAAVRREVIQFQPPKINLAASIAGAS